MDQHPEIELSVGVAGSGCSAPQFLGGSAFTAVMHGHSAFVQRDGVVDFGVGVRVGHFYFPIWRRFAQAALQPIFETSDLES
jgi:hypothetical protein